MSELRERVTGALLAEDDYTAMADAAIRAFAEAMRKPEVVARVAKGMANKTCDVVGYEDGTWRAPYADEEDTWDMMSEENVEVPYEEVGKGRNSFRRDARNAIEAALKAIGATEEEEG